MKYYVLLLTPFASGFVVRPVVRLRPSFSWQLKATKSTDTPAPLPLGFDKTRAVECAETFGKCSMEEVKNIRDCKLQHTTWIQTTNLSHSYVTFPAIHDARVQTMLMSNLAGGNAHVEDTLLQQRLLEDELSLQLTLLQDEMPETKAKVLFPIEATLHPEHHEPDPVAATQSLTLLDENMSDAVAICIVIGILALAPHLLA